MSAFLWSNIYAQIYLYNPGLIIIWTCYMVYRLVAKEMLWYLHVTKRLTIVTQMCMSFCCEWILEISMMFVEIGNVSEY